MTAPIDRCLGAPVTNQCGPGHAADGGRGADLTGPAATCPFTPGCHPSNLSSDDHGNWRGGGTSLVAEDHDAQGDEPGAPEDVAREVRRRSAASRVVRGRPRGRVLRRSLPARGTSVAVLEAGWVRVLVDPHLNGWWIGATARSAGSGSMKCVGLRPWDLVGWTRAGAGRARLCRRAGAERSEGRRHRPTYPWSAPGSRGWTRRGSPVGGDVPGQLTGRDQDVKLICTFVEEAAVAVARCC